VKTTTMDRNLLSAWVFVILVPAAVLPAVLVGEAITALLGYGLTHEQPMPLAAELAVGLPALAVAVLPGLAATVFGLRARRAGHRAGILPAAIGALSVLYWVVLTVVGLIVTP
jgi:hypothetical protein